jgi:hypothetical protein
MTITKSLNADLSLADATKYLFVAALIGFAFWVHDGAKSTSANITSEHACFDASRTKQDVDKCFALMKLNISKE